MTLENYPEVAGRLAVARYFESMISGSTSKSMIFAPGEKKLIFTELSATAVPNGDVVSLKLIF
ncbi:hypothetical protein YSY43_04650 [Paenibacillus sp. YSY-4.3]